jgi:hypothetical protein
MNISVTNSKDEAILSEYFGDKAQIIDIEYRNNLHVVEIFMNKEVFRAFGNSRKRALGNALKAFVKYN